MVMFWKTSVLKGARVSPPTWIAAERDCSTPPSTSTNSTGLSAARMGYKFSASMGSAHASQRRSRPLRQTLEEGCPSPVRKGP